MASLTFVGLYGTDLDRELGSSDRDTLFTTVRRKAAINEAQTWWVTQTGCLTRTGEIGVSDGVADYDLELELADEDFLWLAKEGAHLRQTPATGNETVLSGDQFRRRTKGWLDRYEPGWRTETAGTPRVWYPHDEGGQSIVGLVPTPDVPSGDIWTLFVPYVVKPAAMTADTDKPFTVDGDPKLSVIPWYDALVYYAASELEKLRKGLERSQFFRSQAEGRVLDYLDKQRAPGGKVVSPVRSYRRESSSSWRTNYGARDDPWK